MSARCSAPYDELLSARFEEENCKKQMYACLKPLSVEHMSGRLQVGNLDGLPWWMERMYLRKSKTREVEDSLRREMGWEIDALRILLAFPIRI